MFRDHAEEIAYALAVRAGEREAARLAEAAERESWPGSSLRHLSDRSTGSAEGEGLSDLTATCTDGPPVLPSAEHSLDPA